MDPFDYPCALLEATETFTRSADSLQQNGGDQATPGIFAANSNLVRIAYSSQID